ncbi:TPA: hypothetical protein ACQ301_004401 [Yersinia enterocolitica]
MRLSLFIPCFLAAFVAGCTTSLHTEENFLVDTMFDRVNHMAKSCVTKLSKMSAKNDDKHILTFAFYVSSQTVPVVKSDYTQSVKIAIPYFIADSLDNGEPGSAWRNCMREHQALVAQIKYQ